MRKIACAGVAALLVLLGGTVPSEAWREHPRVFVGPGWWGPVWVEPYPHYLSPPPIIVEPTPAPVHVEPVPTQAAWYFCQSPRGLASPPTPPSSPPS